jgi:cellulose synthase/poly-beta-1,6-N-acetylglucosamine synthase-like glycosyltransferase
LEHVITFFGTHISETIAVIILTALIVDGVKLLWESFAPYREKVFASNHQEVAVLIPLHRKEREIRETLESVKELFSEENIYIVDDCSPDRSLEIAREVAPHANFIALKKNGGKVSAIKHALQQVTQPFSLIIDADVKLPGGFKCPTSILTDEYTAVAFNVMPEGTPGKEDTVWMTLQKYEYLKSMVIGRKFMDRAASVHCISGAAGLFRTERLRELTDKHSGAFPGEDLERTLLELANKGKVIFVDAPIIKTYAPETFGDLVKQRVFGWWPGLWRNIGNYIRLIFTRHAPVQLKLTLIYEVVSLILDPFKIFSLGVLIWFGAWQALFALYVTYTVLELIVLLRVRAGITDARKEGVGVFVVLFYFFYNVLQTFLRVGGLVRMILHRRRLAGAFVFMVSFFSASFAHAGEEKKDWVASVAYQYVDNSHKDGFSNTLLYLGYRDFYVEASTAKQSPRYVTLGAYLTIDNVGMQPSVTIKRGHAVYRVVVEKQIGESPFVGRLGLYYNDLRHDPDFLTFRAGGDYYFGDYDYVSLDALWEPIHDRYTVVGKGYLKVSNVIVLKPGISINDEGNIGPSMFVEVNDLVYFGYSRYNDFDYNDFNRTYWTVGIKVSF